MNFDIINSQETITTVKLMSLFITLKSFVHLFHTLSFITLVFLSVCFHSIANNFVFSITFIVTQWVVINLLNWD